MIWGLFAHESKKNLKDKGLLFWMLILPIIFIVIFGFILGDNQGESASFDIPYVDEDATSESAQFIASLNSSDSFHTVELADADQAKSELEGGDIDAYIFIPSGFAEQLNLEHPNEIQLHYSALSSDTVDPIRTLLESVSYAYQNEKMQRTFANQPELLEQLMTPAVQISEQVLHLENELNPISHMIPGYTVMFTFFIIISMVISCVKDMESGMIARLASTSMNNRHYLLGKWLPYVCIVLIQIIVLLTFGKVVYDIQIGDPIALLLISISLAMITTSWGMAISLLVKNENMGIGITQVIALGGAIIGGLWVPIEFMPKFIQHIGPFLPQYWAQQGFLEVMVYGGGVGQIWLNIIVLLGMSAVGLLVAVWSYPRFLATARS